MNNELRFTAVDGQEYLRMQSKDAREILDISKTQFYKDADDQHWQSEPGPRNAMFHFVPKEYVERRLKEKAMRAQMSQPVDTSVPVNPSPPPPTPAVNQTPLNDNVLTVIESTYRQLIDEKDARIRQLEAQLQSEQQRREELKESHEREANSLRGMVLLSGGKKKLAEMPGFQQVDYLPANSQDSGLLSRMGKALKNLIP